MQMRSGLGWYDEYGNYYEDATYDPPYGETPVDYSYWYGTTYQGDYDVATPTTVQTATGAPTPAQAATIAAANPSSPGALDWLDKLAAAVPKALQLYNAQQIASVNVKRAQQGLPALNPAMYGPQVGVGMNPQTQSMVLMGAVGLAAVMLLKGKGNKGK